MEPVVKSLILKKFRSIPQEQIDFDNPTFLVGRNGSGKSNIVSAFSFLADAMAVPLQAVFDRNGGIESVRNRTSGRSYPPNLGLGILFGRLNGTVRSGRYAFEIRALPNYGFEVVQEQCVARTASGPFWFNRTPSKFESNVKGLEPSLDPALLALPAVGGNVNFVSVLRTISGMRTCSIEPGRVRELQDPDVGTSLKPDGSNAASVLQVIGRQSKQDFERISEILATVVPNTRNVRVVKHGKSLALEFVQEWGDNKRLKFEAYNMSDGTLRALGLLTAVFQKPAPAVLAIEEPEATIHPGALGAVLDLLRHASRNMQVVITTHSPEVLDEKWIKENHLRIVDWHEGATSVSRVSERSRKALQQHLMGAGELMRANALDAAPRLFEDAETIRTMPLFEEIA